MYTWEVLKYTGMVVRFEIVPSASRLLEGKLEPPKKIAEKVN